MIQELGRREHWLAGVGRSSLAGLQERCVTDRSNDCRRMVEEAAETRERALGLEYDGRGKDVPQRWGRVDQARGEQLAGRWGTRCVGLRVEVGPQCRGKVASGRVEGWVKEWSDVWGVGSRVDRGKHGRRRVASGLGEGWV